LHKDTLDTQDTTTFCARIRGLLLGMGAKLAFGTFDVCPGAVEFCESFLSRVGSGCEVPQPGSCMAPG
jgi:hypothetical protein